MPWIQYKDKASKVWDLVSQTNVPFLSYILFSFLPVQDLKRTYQFLTALLYEEVRRHGYFYRRSKVSVIGSGSTAEGLSCPHIPHPKWIQSILPKSQKSYEELAQAHDNTADLDLMIARPCAASANETENDYSVEISKELHPGYARLVMNGMVMNQDEKICVKSTIFAITSQSEGVLASQTYDLHGPAQRKISKREINDTPEFKSVDKVFCLSYPLWPDEASEWLHRPRPCGWPPQFLIDTATCGGCHFVPVPHPTSSRPDVEWRFSFSQAEVALAQSLTWTQRQCYVITKMLCKHVIGESTAWCTYYLKTVFFWYCERTPACAWKPINLASCFLGLVDELLKYFRNHNIPNYFIPSNNMISHMSPETTKSVQDKIISLRRDPLKYIMEWMETYANTYSLLSEPFENVHRDFIDSVRNPLAQLHRGKVQIQSVKLSTIFVKDGMPILAVENLEDCLSFLELEDTSFCVDNFMSIYKSLLDDKRLSVFGMVDAMTVIQRRLNKREKGLTSASYTDKLSTEYVPLSTLSQIDDFIDETLLKIEAHPELTYDVDFKAEVLLYKAIFVYMAGIYQDAFDYADYILNELDFADYSSGEELNYTYNSLLQDDHAPHGAMIGRKGLVSAHALYVMLKSGRRANLLNDETSIQLAFQQVLNRPYEITVIYNSVPLAHCYAEVDQHMYAILYFILAPGAERFVVSSTLMDILTCFILELLQIAMQDKAVISRKFRLLSLRALEVFANPEKANSCNRYDIGNLLCHLAHLYENRMMSSVGHIEYKEKCYLAYLASLHYNNCLDTDVLNDFIGFLFRCRHPFIHYAPDFFKRLLALRKDPVDHRVVDHIPCIPYLDVAWTMSEICTTTSLLDALLKCLELAI